MLREILVGLRFAARADGSRPVITTLALADATIDLVRYILAESDE